MLAPRTQDVLGLLLDEVWDLNDSIDELERRRARLRDHIADICRRASATRWQHPRGNVRVDRYGSYKVARPTAVLPQIQNLGWEDQVLQIKGRALYKLAAERPNTRALFAEHCRETQHDVLVLTPTKRRR